ncbi:zinc finger protein 483-like isoform X2 [Tachysurus fulvidraco]|uniref:zinc finger protein 483-like isoform X2 n=1 Tax=Tachysurus fulvidraco TaxID=1234273 RepID=UPI000F4F262E|nr:zinc finger protein 483-like isoform X2 [Tachysurus fulvidraco]
MMQLQSMAEVCSLNSEGLWCGDEVQHSDQTDLKICAVKLVDIRKIQTLDGNTMSEKLPSGAPGESTMFDGDQETLQAQIKMSSGRLMDYRKVEAEDKSSRFDGDQQTLHAQLKMSSVRLVDCGKIQSSKSAAKSDPEGQISRFVGDQQKLEAQLKVCLVKLVDCRKAAVEGKSNQSSDEEDEEQTIKRKSPRKLKFGRSSYALHLSGEHIVLCKGQRVFQCSGCSERFSSSLDFRRHQNMHPEEKAYQCTRCGKDFSQRSQVRRHQRVHAGEKP